MKKIIALVIVLFLVTACSQKASGSKDIRIASHTEPMTDVIEIAKTLLEKDGYTVELVKVADNTAGNIALNSKEIDANFFQHVPYMEAFNKAHDANLVGITPIYDAIVGYYSKDIASKEDIPVGASVGLPNDTDNQARALIILEQAGLIKLKNPGSESSTIEDVVENKLELKFVPVDLLTLTHAYEDVDFLFNYPTYISSIGLTPLKDAIIVEESTSYFAISLVAREDNKDSDKIKALKKAMTSSEVKEFLENEKNAATLVPSF